MLLPICLAQTVLGRKLTTPDFMAGFHIFDADQDGFIGLADVQGLRIGPGIDGDGPDTHAAGGAEDATGDLATIGDQDGFKHGSVLDGSGDEWLVISG